MAKFIHINSVMRVNLANLNSSEGGTNQIILKKITAFNGEEFVYVSGQAYRRYLRETIYWLTDKKFEICGIDNNGSPIIEKDGEPLVKDKKIFDEELKKGKYNGIMEYIVKNVPELDMFGFLLSVSEKDLGTLRKTSPFQTTAFISSFPYRYNTDMLTRRKAEEMGGDIVKVEIDTFNYLQGAQIINTEMVGAYWDEHKEKVVSVKNSEPNKRINWLLSALQNTMGGSKKARLLEDFSPVLTIGTVQKTGVPYFLHKFEITPPDKNIKAQSFADVKGNLNLVRFMETYNSIAPYLDKAYLGIEPNAFLNGEALKESIKGIKGIEICKSPRGVYDKLKDEFPIESNKNKE
jgi:CRISPR-associated protein Cst2